MTGLEGLALELAMQKKNQQNSLISTAIDFGISRLNYGRQRKDAIADWEMQNAYNHPSAQMARLREAGLNPNLVYKGGATTEAAPVRSSSIQDTNFQVRPFDAGSALGAYYDTQVKQAQIDNLKDQNTLIKEQASHEAVKKALTMAEEATKSYDLAFKKRLQEYSADIIRYQSQKLGWETDSAEEDAKVKMRTQDTRVEQTIANLAQSRLNQAKSEAETKEILQRIENLKKEGKLKQLEANLREEGLSPNDPAWMRIIMQQAKKWGLVP